VRVAIADDSAIVREGLARVLAAIYKRRVHAVLAFLRAYY